MRHLLPTVCLLALGCSGPSARSRLQGTWQFGDVEDHTAVEFVIEFEGDEYRTRHSLTATRTGNVFHSVSSEGKFSATGDVITFHGWREDPDSRGTIHRMTYAVDGQVLTLTPFDKNGKTWILRRRAANGTAG